MEFPEPHILNRSLENTEDEEDSQLLSKIQHSKLRAIVIREAEYRNSSKTL